MTTRRCCSAASSATQTQCSLGSTNASPVEPPEWLSFVSEFASSGIYSSAVDTIWPRAFPAALAGNAADL